NHLDVFQTTARRQGVAMKIVLIMVAVILVILGCVTIGFSYPFFYKAKESRHAYHYFMERGDVDNAEDEARHADDWSKSGILRCVFGVMMIGGGVTLFVVGIKSKRSAGVQSP